MKYFLFLTILIAFSLSANSVGKIDTVKGLAFIKHTNTKGYKRLKLSTEVSYGDIIKTAKNGKVKILFDDNSELYVYSKTLMRINKSKMIAKTNSKDLTLLAGRLWARISKRVTPNNYFKVNTPTATAGVRGTDFGIIVSGDGSSLVKVQAGEVLFDSDIDPALDKKESKAQETKKEAVNLMADGQLNIKTSKINLEDVSIDIDEVTGVKKKSILLGKNKEASYLLDKGIKTGEKIDVDNFVKERKMPTDKAKRKKIISYHISNMNKRLNKSKELRFKVTKIANEINIDLMKDGASLKFKTLKISSTNKKGQKDILHIAKRMDELQTSLDAQALYLEEYQNEDTKEALDKYNKEKKENDKILNKLGE